MPRGRPHRVLLALLCLASLAYVAAPTRAQIFPHQEELWQDALLELAIPGVLSDTVRVAGPALLGWGDPFPSGPYLLTESRWLTMELAGDDPPVLVRVRAAGPPSLGLARGVAPEPMPAESFFDVFLELELPTLLPGVTLHNPTPLHATATVEQMPPYFSVHATAPGGLVSLVDELGEPRGDIHLWDARLAQYSPPRAHLIVASCYGTDEAELDEIGWVPVSGYVTGADEPTLATFSWRPALPGAPWTQFAIDPDGRDEVASTFYDEGTGDGWTEYFDPALAGPAGAYVEFKVEFQMPAGAVRADSLVRWVTAQPLLAELVTCPPESLLAGRPGELVKVMVRLLQEHSRVQDLKLWAFPFPLDKHRTLEPVDQFDISRGRDPKLDEMSCGPAAMASCLKYFAANGHPELEHPKGDLARPVIGATSLAWELGLWMGTNRRRGTSTKGMASGVKDYLDCNGHPGWTASRQRVDDYSDVAKMFREFEADGEDVIMLLEDPPDAEGKRRGHFVTLGSKSSRVYNVVTETADIMGVSYRLDFMDPAGGGPTSENEYDIGSDAQGRPTVTGYEGFRDGGVPPPRIKEYVKVSPPGQGGGGAVFPTAGVNLSPGWILVDAIPATGAGVVDTLTWDTDGFVPGLYLMMVVASSPTGRENSVIRLGGIAEYTLDAPGGAPARTGLRGARPNPTRTGAVVEFTLVADGVVDLTVYDAQGRVVRRLLAAAAYPAGVHRVAWDGRTDGGAAAGSGVYFCRFRGGGVTEEGKIVVVR